MADKMTLDRHALKNPATAHLRIYVGGLTDRASEDEIYEHFIQYGQINGIAVNRGFGFVQFETEASAQEAISKADGSLLLGKCINVKTAQTNTDNRRAPDNTQTEVAPSAVSSEKVGVEDTEENYDMYGNYIGDHGYPDEEYEESFSPARGRGRGSRGARGRGRARGGGPQGFRDRSPLSGRGEWAERERYERFERPLPDYPRALPVPERNDCEIIVVSKGLTEYAEYIEGRLKRLGIVVDLLFPMEDVPIGKVLGNIASRGCLYAILVMPQNQENRSMTLTILHGLPQEHRNMPLEDALQLLSRNFQEVQRGGPSGREAVYALLGQLADGRTLTVLQYDKVIEYLQERREQQVKIELGEPTAPTNKTQVDLQQRILSILNEKKIDPKPLANPTPAPATAQQNKLLDDPTVRKALDSILQKFT